MIKEHEEKPNEDDTESDHDAEVEEKPKPKKPAKKSKPKAPAKPRIKPSFYYVSSSEDEAGMLKDRFWKDLEDGKVDIFRTADLYSTVKAIGRTARPKSLAESDLRRSGLRSAFNQPPVEKDEVVEADKGKSKKGRKGKAGSERSLRSVTPKSGSGGVVSVNLGVKVDHELSSVGRGSKSSDDDDDDEEIEETKLKTRKKKKKGKKKEDVEDEEEEDEEEEVEVERPKKTKRKSLKLVGAKKTKKKRKDEQTEEESEVEEKEDEDEDDSESVKKITGEDAAGAKKEKKIKKASDRTDDDDDADDNDNEDDDNRKPKNKDDAKLKKKSVAANDDDDDDDGEDDDDDDVDDEQKEEDKEDDDNGGDREKIAQRMKRKADVPISKPNKKKKLELDEGKYEGDEEKEEAGEDDEKSEETPPKKIPEKTIKPKTKVQGAESDPDVVRQHMLEAIDRVIAQSSALWREGHTADEGGIHEKDDTSGDTRAGGGVENPESAVMAPPKAKTGKTNKKRKEHEEEEVDNDDDGEVGRGAVSLKSWKPSDTVIDYYFSEEHDDSESEDTARKPPAAKKRSKVKNQAKKKKKERVENSLETAMMPERLDVAEARSTEGEPPCGDKDLEGTEPDVIDDVKDETTGENEEQLKKDLSVAEENASSAAATEALETSDHHHHPDQKEEFENEEPANEDSVVADKEPAENSNVAVEDTSLDHLVFDLPTVESVDPVDERDSYAESNIKVLTNGDLYQAVKFNDFGVVEAMMREAYQFDLEQVDPQTGLTLTMVATLNYSMEIVELLVLSGANVNARAKDGHTALTLACDKGLHCAASLLLCLGANVGCQLPGGETALILAVRKDHYHVARVLLEHGVNIGASAVGERHALSLARQLNHQPLVELLTAHKTRLTTELFQQVSMALEGSAKLGTLVFPIQCFRLCDGNRFRVDFRHELQPTQTSRGMLLFIGHGRGSATDMQVRLFGTCAVTKAVLNNVALQSLNEDNFILTFCPLRDGHNQLDIFTVPLSRNTYKVHLTVAAFVVTLV